MRLRRMMAAAAILAVAATAVMAAADSTGWKNGERAKKFAQMLGLTADQQERLKALRPEMQAIRKEERDRMQVIMDKSKVELLKPSPDRVVLYGYAREMGALRTEMAQKEADHLLKVKAVLSPEQFAKLLNRPPREFHGGPPGAEGHGPEGNGPRGDGE